MAERIVFDREHYRRFDESRRSTLDEILPLLIREARISNCIDVGCGVGFFSDHMRKSGLTTVAVDGRENNVAEARRRFPEIEFHVRDVESDGLKELGVFDLVLCIGLLYHLENPFRAIRNLEAMTEKVMLVESLIAPGREPLAALIDEGRGDDQSLRYTAFIPSESCLIKMLYGAGFKKVYRIAPLPDHEQFRGRITRRRCRTMVVASRFELSSPMLSLLRTCPAEIYGQPSRAG